MHIRVPQFCILLFALATGACSVPNLESPACTEARTFARQFYSFHFANDMAPSPEGLRARERFLTPEYYNELVEALNERSVIDPFTGSHPPPTAFRIGKCESKADKAVFEVQLFWRTDEISTQKEVDISLVKAGDRWLVSQVGSLF
ncbi:MAG TPA: hypothetical protein VNA17_00825 [Pyrinomonadaceae bacterium]|nr:hypothetical protein [Pyrinomonadaceae bacterium]